MAGTVSSHQQTAFTTPINGANADATVVLGNDNNTVASYNAHDADGTIHLQSSVLGSRPAAGTLGRKWLTTDGLRVYYDTGATWSEIAYLPSVGGTVSGVTTFSNTTNSSSISTGAVVISGGLGVTKAVYLGSTLNVAGASTFTGLITVNGGLTTGATYGIGVGTAVSATASVAILAGTTAHAQINLAAGTAPTSPNDGDIWYDGSHFYGRIGSSSKQLDN